MQDEPEYVKQRRCALKTSHRLIAWLNDDLAIVSSPSGEQMWTKGKVIGRNKRCCACLKDIPKGQTALRPVTNAANRGDRLHIECLVVTGHAPKV